MIGHRRVTVTNSSVFGNAKKIVRRMRRAFSGEDDLTPSAFSIFLFISLFFVSGQGDFSYTGDIHGRKWPSHTNTEVQASST